MTRLFVLALWTVWPCAARADFARMDLTGNGGQSNMTVRAEGPGYSGAFSLEIAADADVDIGALQWTINVNGADDDDLFFIYFDRTDPASFGDLFSLDDPPDMTKFIPADLTIWSQTALGARLPDYIFRMQGETSAAHFPGSLLNFMIEGDNVPPGTYGFAIGDGPPSEDVFCGPVECGPLMPGSVFTLEVLPSADSYTLLVSTNADRSDPAALQGRTVGDDIHVFVNPAEGVTEVAFWLDDPDRTGAPLRVDDAAPFDLVGGDDAAALPFDTLGLDNGAHRVTALLTLDGGGAQVLQAGFTVENIPPALVFTESAVEVAVPVGQSGTATVELVTNDTSQVAYGLSEGTAWLKVAGDSGTTPDQLTLTFDSAGLDVGVYETTLEATADGYAAAALAVRLEVYIVPMARLDLTGNGGQGRMTVRTEPGGWNGAFPLEVSADSNVDIGAFQWTINANEGEDDHRFFIFFDRTSPDSFGDLFSLDDPPDTTKFIPADLAVWSDTGLGGRLPDYIFRMQGETSVTHFPASLLNFTIQGDHISAGSYAFAIGDGPAHEDVFCGPAACDMLTPGTAFELEVLPAVEAYTLMVSSKNGRTSPAPLQDQVLVGDAFVFLGPSDGVTDVSFWLDDPERTDAPVRMDDAAPFDLVGGDAATALPFDTNNLRNGAHTVTALLTLAEGDTHLVQADFTIDNPLPVLAFNTSQTGIGLQSGKTGSAGVTLEADDNSATSYTLSEDASWLEASGLDGITPDQVTLSFDAAGLNPGVYETTLTASAVDYVSATILVRLTVLGTKPAGRIDLTAEGGRDAIEVDPSTGAGWTGQFVLETTFHCNVAISELQWAIHAGGGAANDLFMIEFDANARDSYGDLFSLDAPYDATRFVVSELTPASDGLLSDRAADVIARAEGLTSADHFPGSLLRYTIRGVNVPTGTYTFTVGDDGSGQPARFCHASGCADLTAGQNVTLTVRPDAGTGDPPAPLVAFDPSAVSLEADQDGVSDWLSIDVTSNNGENVTCELTASAPWLKLDRTNVTTPGYFNIRADASGMAPGSYTAGVIAAPTGADAVVLPVTLTVFSTAGFELLVSSSPDRSAAGPLHGATVGGDIYAFITPHPDIHRIWFHLDDPARSWAPFSIERRVPYDLAGTDGPMAYPFDTRTLADGGHSVTAEVTTLSGGVSIVHADFTIVNDQPSLLLEKDTLAFTLTQGEQTIASVAVNTSHGSAVGYTVNTDADWITPVTTTGTAPGTVAMNIDADGLEPGAYTATVEVSAAGYQSDAVRVTLTVSPGGYELRVSTSPDRSAAMSLQDAVLTGDAFVFLWPEDNVFRVEFYIDDPDMQAPRFSGERRAPYDLAGGSPAVANPFDTTALTGGPHTVTARVYPRSGGSVPLHATFKVDNTLAGMAAGNAP